MRNFTKSWLLKTIMFSLAIFLGLNSTSWAQGVKGYQRDPSTITIVPLSQEGGRAVGDDCTNPIIVSVPAALPYRYYEIIRADALTIIHCLHPVVCIIIPAVRILFTVWMLLPTLLVTLTMNPRAQPIPVLEFSLVAQAPALVWSLLMIQRASNSVISEYQLDGWKSVLCDD